MQTRNPYAMNKNVNIQSVSMGKEGQKILIIDGLMEYPQAMVSFAANHANFGLHQKAGNFYPGVRLLPPPDYFEQLMGIIGPVLAVEYNIPVTAEMTKAECSISLLTLKPEELSPMQSAPHFDSANPNQFALLHYLCSDKHGGTAFYRHNTTGYETITSERFNHYTTSFMHDVETNGPPKQEYIVASNQRFTKIGAVQAVYNRLIIYRSCLLHSADVDPAVSVDTDPTTGRLTANSFVAFAV